MKGTFSYFLTRMLQVVPTVLGVLVIVFFFVRALPGDPARLYAGTDATATEVAEIRERLGLNESIAGQFGRYVSDLTRLEFGTSFRSGRPVYDTVKKAFVPTLLLAISATVVAIIGGMLFGLLAAVKRGSTLDISMMSLSMLGISVPSFFLALLLIYLFAVNLRWLPVSGSVSFIGLVLPTVTLGLPSMSTVARFARSSVLEVLGQDYIRTAKAKGLTNRRVLYQHALRNALIPIVTIVGLQFGSLVSGAIIVETIFNLPGLGWLLIQSIDARDYPVIQALMLVFALQFLIINLVIDLLYAVIDPRISYA